MPKHAQSESRRPGAPDAPATQGTAQRPAKAVTMADVAARLGVSKMTVSRALRRGSSALRASSEALRQRILRTCQEMGYVVDQTARSFSSQRTGIVAALIPALNNSNFSDTAHGLAAALESRGLQVLLGYTDYSLATEERLIRAMLARRPEAIVVTGGDHTAQARRLLKAAAVPVVETWDLLTDPVEHTVGFSNAEAVGALVRALHRGGYRRIAFMGGTPHSDARGADRRRGFEQAMNELGLRAHRIISVGQAPIAMSDGAIGMAQLLKRWPDVDAVVCVSDHPAFGALMECRRQGWSVPGRIAIAGFGGFEVSAACEPQITTVVVDCHGIGRATGELLVRAIDAARLGERLQPETIVVPYRIELRGST